MYIKDDTAELARLMGATRTPHAFVFDASRQLVYSGPIDDSPGDPDAVGITHVEDVIRAIASGAPIERAALRPFGCKIKNP